jgi:cell division septation protein DedD
LRVKKRRGIYEVTIGQLIVSMLIITVAITAVFFIGAYIGKNRVINDERKSQELNETKLISRLKENIGNGTSKVTTNLKEHSEDAIKSAKKKLDIVTDEQKTNQAKQITDESTYMNQAVKPDKKPLPTIDQSTTIKKPEVIKKTRYTVKVGTFSSYENAKKLFDSLKSSGYEPQLIKESAQGKTLCHVSVGDFDSEDKARQYGDTLREKLPFVNDYVIRTYDSPHQEKDRSKQ